MRLRVSDFPSINGSSITPAEADGFYDRVIGEMRDDRFVYINPQSRIWFYSYSFRWIFSTSFVEDLYEAIYDDDDVVSKNINWNILLLFLFHNNFYLDL